MPASHLASRVNKSACDPEFAAGVNCVTVMGEETNGVRSRSSDALEGTIAKDYTRGEDFQEMAAARRMIEWTSELYKRVKQLLSQRARFAARAF